MTSPIAAPETSPTPDRPSSEATPAQGPEALQLRNECNRFHQSTVAATRDKWIRRNHYYYELLGRLLRHLVEPGQPVLNIRSQTGFFLNAVQPRYVVGVDIGAEMIEVARIAHPEVK